MSFFLAGPTAKTVYRNGERFGTIAIMPREPTGVMGNRLEVERLENVSGHIVLCFKGPLTMNNVFVFLSALKQEEKLPSLILDFSGVPYIDSTALGALVNAYVSRQKMGKRVALSGISDRVSKMLKTTKVESLFLTFPTREDAIGGLTGTRAA